MTDLRQTYYRQVKSPSPVFTPRRGAETLKFCEELVEKAVGFVPCFDFAAHVTRARSHGPCRRMPPVLRRRTIDALPQGLCLHYDPLASRVQCSIITLVIECGLTTEFGAGELSITRATRALTFLSELGLITYQTEHDPLIRCYVPTDVTFTPALFVVLDVSEVVVASAHRSRMEWENRQREERGLDALGMDELIAKAWCFMHKRFHSYQTELRSRGIRRARVCRDVGREHQDIVTSVKRQPTREISEGRLTASREAVKREMGRRVKEHVILSRNRGYSRLATASS